MVAQRIGDSLSTESYMVLRVFVELTYPIRLKSKFQLCWPPHRHFHDTHYTNVLDV